MDGVRPIILAAGRGTRLRPRTDILPKPMLPILGRPLLWYVLRTVDQPGLLPPVVVTGYKGDLIRAYFQHDGVEFLDLPGSSMLEAFMTAADHYPSPVFLGLSADVLVQPQAIEDGVAWYGRGECDAAVLFTRLRAIGHKKWRFKVENHVLRDIKREEHKTDWERVCLVASGSSLAKIATRVPRPISQETVPANLQPFQTGWILFLKTLVQCGGHVRASVGEFPHMNVNTKADLQAAACFVTEHGLG